MKFTNHLPFLIVVLIIGFVAGFFSGGQFGKSAALQAAGPTPENEQLIVQLESELENLQTRLTVLQDEATRTQGDLTHPLPERRQYAESIRESVEAVQERIGQIEPELSSSKLSRALRQTNNPFDDIVRGLEVRYSSDLSGLIVRRGNLLDRISELHGEIREVVEEIEEYQDGITANQRKIADGLAIDPRFINSDEHLRLVSHNNSLRSAVKASKDDFTLMREEHASINRQIGLLNEAIPRARGLWNITRDIIRRFGIPVIGITIFGAGGTLFGDETEVQPPAGTSPFTDPNTLPSIQEGTQSGSQQTQQMQQQRQELMEAAEQILQTPDTDTSFSPPPVSGQSPN